MPTRLIRIVIYRSVLIVLIWLSYYHHTCHGKQISGFTRLYVHYGYMEGHVYLLWGQSDGCG